MDVAAIGAQVENRIAHDLSRPVVRHVPATAGFVNLDSGLRQLFRRGDNVGTAAVAFYAERDHRRMLEEQQNVRQPVGATLLDESALHDERIRIPDGAESSNLKLPGHAACDRITPD